MEDKLNLGEGLIKQLEKGPSVPLDEATIATKIKGLFYNEREPVNITIVTGLRGMYDFTFAMMGVQGYIKARSWIYCTNKRPYKYIISIGKKEGMLKVVISPKDCKFSNTYQIIYGTKEIGRSNDFNDINKYIHIY